MTCVLLAGCLQCHSKRDCRRGGPGPQCNHICIRGHWKVNYAQNLPYNGLCKNVSRAYCSRRFQLVLLLSRSIMLSQSVRSLSTWGLRNEYTRACIWIVIERNLQRRTTHAYLLNRMIKMACSSACHRDFNFPMLESKPNSISPMFLLEVLINFGFLTAGRHTQWRVHQRTQVLWS